MPAMTQAERIHEDLAYAAPELWLWKIEMRLAQVREDAVDDFASQLIKKVGEIESHILGKPGISRVDVTGVISALQQEFDVSDPTKRDAE